MRNSLTVIQITTKFQMNRRAPKCNKGSWCGVNINLWIAFCEYLRDNSFVFDCCQRQLGIWNYGGKCALQATQSRGPKTSICQILNFWYIRVLTLNPLPAQCLSIKVFAVSVVYNDDFWVFVKVTFHGSLWVVGYVAFVAYLVSSPPKPITLCILLCKH